ncbi:MAG: hypothetical protein GX891_02300 [Clostridiales bacterium]|nr:hypothetical protein [Clostridiales bacterium]
MKKVRDTLFFITLALSCAAAVCMIVLWFVAVPRTAKIGVAATFISLAVLLLFQLIISMVTDEKIRKKLKDEEPPIDEQIKILEAELKKLKEKKDKN